MEMVVGKIACFVILCMVMVAPYHAEALSCGQVTSNLAPCLPYLQGRGDLGGCCSGVKSLLAAAQTKADQRTACNCIKAATFNGLDLGRAAGLPATCGVNIPYEISPSVDCSKIQ